MSQLSAEVVLAGAPAKNTLKNCIDLANFWAFQEESGEVLGILRGNRPIFGHFKGIRPIFGHFKGDQAILGLKAVRFSCDFLKHAYV